MAAAGKAKSASTSGAGKKAEPSPRPPQEPAEPVSYGSGKPDKALYDAEQAKLKTEIDALQVKLVRLVLSLRCVVSRSMRADVVAVCRKGEDWLDWQGRRWKR